MVLAPKVLSGTGYIKQPLLFREILRLWDYPGDITQNMNKDQLRSLWEDICLTPNSKVLASDLELSIDSYCLGLKSGRKDLILKKNRDTGTKKPRHLHYIRGH